MVFHQWPQLHVMIGLIIFDRNNALIDIPIIIYYYNIVKICFYNKLLLLVSFIVNIGVP